MSLGSSRPYLIRALYEWIVDGGEDPFLLVDATYPEVRVPQTHVADGQIVLNAAPSAIAGLSTDAFAFRFQARFGGVPQQIRLPYGSILAIYGRESGLGMAFGQEPGGVPERPSVPECDPAEGMTVAEPVLEPPAEQSELFTTEEIQVPRARPKRPPLRLVKSDD